MDVRGKVALVTGASRGVGAALAVALAERGADVACAARATDAAPVPIPGTIDETVRKVEAVGGRGVAVPTNLADEHEVEAMVARTEEAFGRVDILVNNAAITFPGDLDLPMKRYDLIMAVDLRAPVVATRAVLPGMRSRGEGVVINISSAAALNYFPGLMAYGMAKVALEHFTVDASEQVRDDDVAVNCFRIDVPVASEGFLAALPEVDHSDWEPPAVAAEGILWMIEQPPSYTGHCAGMAALRDAEGIMASQATRRYTMPTSQRTE